MRSKMGGGNKSYCLYALVEVGDDFACHLFQAVRFGSDDGFSPAYLVVLTIEAMEIATCEKDIADAIGSADSRFLSPVQTNGCDMITGI
jgi:hypothetical protein